MAAELARTSRPARTKAPRARLAVRNPSRRRKRAASERNGEPAGDAAARRGKRLLEAHFDLIQQRLGQLSRRSGLPAHEAEDFPSWALLRLVEDDYRVLASWAGRSSFSTYLNVVVVNLMRDYRNHVLGKWRPSAAASRQGREAVLLERLWVRDCLPLEEAIHRLRSEHRVALSPTDLERIAANLRQRARRRHVGEEELRRLPVDGSVETRLEERERGRTLRHLRAALLPSLAALPAEYRLLLKLYFRDGLTMAAIAPLLRRSQRQLYSMRDRCLKSLRKALEAAGVSAEQTLTANDSSGEDLGLEREGIWG